MWSGAGGEVELDRLRTKAGLHESDAILTGRNVGNDGSARGGADDGE